MTGCRIGVLREVNPCQIVLFISEGNKTTGCMAGFDRLPSSAIWLPKDQRSALWPRVSSPTSARSVSVPLSHGSSSVLLPLAVSPFPRLL